MVCSTHRPFAVFFGSVLGLVCPNNTNDPETHIALFRLEFAHCRNREMCKGKWGARDQSAKERMGTIESRETREPKIYTFGKCIQ